jgi:hypothetical protein
VKASLRDLTAAHGMRFGDPHRELLARTLSDERFYRRHPVHAAWWLLRYSRPSTVGRTREELRSGSFHFVG